MSNRLDTHSKLVAWAKIVLPILALALLSTLFLLSKSVDPVATIPFSDTDIEERTRSQQISSPEVFGTSARGDMFVLRSEYARHSLTNAKITEASEIEAKIKLIDGAELTLRSAEAKYNASQSLVDLAGEVKAVSSLGYVFASSNVQVNLEDMIVEAQGPVTGEGPATSIRANSMHLEVPTGEKDAQLLFSGDVKLIYLPQQPKE